jgi:large subunit ribosomal protein L22
VKIVCDLIRNQDVDQALAILRNTPKAASELLFKLVTSAAANAENNHALNVDNLYVSQVFANPGPTLKRGMPRARGGSSRILKRTSHITVVVKERDA